MAWIQRSPRGSSQTKNQEGKVWQGEGLRYSERDHLTRDATLKLLYRQSGGRYEQGERDEREQQLCVGTDHDQKVAKESGVIFQLTCQERQMKAINATRGTGFRPIIYSTAAVFAAALALPASAQVPPPPQAEGRKIFSLANVVRSELPADTVTTFSLLMVIFTGPDCTNFFCA